MQMFEALSLVPENLDHTIQSQGAKITLKSLINDLKKGKFGDCEHIDDFKEKMMGPVETPNLDDIPEPVDPDLLNESPSRLVPEIKPVPGQSASFNTIPRNNKLLLEKFWGKPDLDL